MAESKTDPVLRDSIIAAFSRFSGNVSAVSRELGCSRSTVRRNIAKVGIGKKPLAVQPTRKKLYPEQER